MSFGEAIANVIAGYGIALLTQVVLFPLFGLRLTLTENIAIAGVFTVISIARSYLLRRFFERLRTRRRMSKAAAHAGGGSNRLG